jgi:hypothetical protein
MTDAMPEGYVVHLPPFKHPRAPHAFGWPVSVPADPDAGHHAQTERTCVICGAVKVTVHGPDDKHWREWRRAADAEQTTGDIVVCEPREPLPGVVA